MTVGIGAAYDGQEPAAVLVADRRVTTGAVEHEQADGKLEMLYPGNPAVAAVAAGTLAYSDELYYRAGNRLLDDEPRTVQDVGETLVTAMHDIVRTEANNQILQNYDLTVSQLTNDEVPLADDIVADLLGSVSNFRNEIQEQTHLLLAGVDDRHGAQILELRNGSLVRHSSLGYQSIGSGANSARLTFMRNGYDPDSLKDAVVLAADAKNQAGEAQGVGEKMDIAIVSDGVNILDDGDVATIQSLIEDVREAERSARQNTITREDVPLGR